ncbi:two-component response regulator ORR1-like [Magnolia sinica]|uniref:two-component response regulator ORR1-like n=1 Tax=Magnolia sinica TaxID=86752 RepID=UPI00265AFFA1|nr:two-component response regulator ORR1-like [Magnolia sinica]
MGEAPLIHVLAVDDCPIDRKIVEKLLIKASSFKVTAVDSGKKALEVLLGLNEEDVECPGVNDCRIDVILTDYCMPEMSGHDLLKVVKEHNCLKSIPVVVMSSEKEPQRISGCIAMGAEDFILKPLHLRDIQGLRNHVKPMAPISKTGTKRKMPHDVMPDTNDSERRPCFTGVAVA